MESAPPQYAPSAQSYPPHPPSYAPIASDFIDPALQDPAPLFLPPPPPPPPPPPLPGVHASDIHTPRDVLQYSPPKHKKFVFYTPVVGPFAQQFHQQLSPNAGVGAGPLPQLMVPTERVPVWRACEKCIQNKRRCPHKIPVLLPLKTDGPNATSTPIANYPFPPPDYKRAPPGKGIRKPSKRRRTGDDIGAVLVSVPIHDPNGIAAPIQHAISTDPAAAERARARMRWTSTVPGGGQAAEEAETVAATALRAAGQQEGQQEEQRKEQRQESTEEVITVKRRPTGAIIPPPQSSFPAPEPEPELAPVKRKPGRPRKHPLVVKPPVTPSKPTAKSTTKSAILKPKPKPKPKAKAKPKPTPTSVAKTQTEARPKARPEAQPEARLEARPAVPKEPELAPEPQREVTDEGFHDEVPERLPLPEPELEQYFEPEPLPLLASELERRRNHRLAPSQRYTSTPRRRSHLRGSITFNRWRDAQIPAKQLASINRWKNPRYDPGCWSGPKVYTPLTFNPPVRGPGLVLVPSKTARMQVQAQETENMEDIGEAWNGKVEEPDDDEPGKLSRALSPEL